MATLWSKEAGRKWLRQMKIAKVDKVDGRVFGAHKPTGWKEPLAFPPPRKT